MISKYRHNALNWIDLEFPNEEEIAHIFEEYSIPRSIIEVTSKEMNKCKIGNIYGFLVVYIELPQVSPKKNGVLFISGEDILITIHDEKIHAFDEISKDLELDIMDSERSKITSNKLLFTYLIKALYLNLTNEVTINKKHVSNLKKEVIYYKRKVKTFKILFFTLIGLIILTSVLWL